GTKEPGRLVLSYHPCIAVVPVVRRHICPAYAARYEVLMIVSNHAEKSFIGLKDLTVEIPDTDSDDVRVDQAPDLRFALCEVAVQTGILQRDRRLRGEQLQHRYPARRKDARCQVVLKVENADELGLRDQGQAENGASLAVPDVGIGSKLGLHRGVVENNVILGAKGIV